MTDGDARKPGFQVVICQLLLLWNILGKFEVLAVLMVNNFAVRKAEEFWLPILFNYLKSGKGHGNVYCTKESVY
jgi:hypothetical protein